MSKWKEEALQQYKVECFKQTRPYQYEIAYLDEEGEGPNGNSPASVSGTVFRFPDATRNILNFEGIASEYLIFVGEDGVCEPDMVEKLLSNNRGADIIYCDEDFITDINADITDINVRIRKLRTVFRKPEYSPDTIMSFPYFGSCFAVRTAFARNVPVLKPSSEITDYIRVWDFILRATERTSRVAHVPSVLYHRDLSKLMENRNDLDELYDEEIFEALYEKYNHPGYQLCREAAARRRGLCELPVVEAKTEKESKTLPLVSIIIPSKDNSEMLKECIRNIRINAGKIKYEIIIVDNGSCEEERLSVEHLLENLPANIDTKYLFEPAEFNFATMCNKGAMAAKAPFFLFLNDDVYAVQEKFLEELIKYAQLPYVGAVGAKLLYPDGKTIQHVGVTDINRGPTHKLITQSDTQIQYFGRNRYVWNVLAVTAACLMVEREKYFQVGGFSDKMKVGYNDVDFCVKLYENHYFNVVNNECTLIHHESVSRGLDITPEKNSRLKSERMLFYENHKWLFAGYDPFYSPYLDRDTIEYQSYGVADYQITDFRNKVKELPKCAGHMSNKVMFNIDRCYTEWAIGDNVEDAYVFDGWSIVNKFDNVGVKRYLVFLPLDDDGNVLKGCIIANVSPKYRTDIKQVFPDAINVLLAGFECRVPVSMLDANRKYQLGVLIKCKGQLNKNKLSLGDIYEPGRGIITDIEILSEPIRAGKGEEQEPDAGVS